MQLAAQPKQTGESTANSFSKVSFHKPIQEADSLKSSIKSIDATSQQALAQIKRGGETAAVAINKMAIAANPSNGSPIANPIVMPSINVILTSYIFANI